MSKYDADFYEWTQEQSERLRCLHERKDDRLLTFGLDSENLAGEIESLGQRDRRELVSRMEVLVAHILKWTLQPEHRGNSWRDTIWTQQDEIEKILEQSPSLRRYLQQPQVWIGMYHRARRKAKRQTGLFRLPDECPWTLDEVLSYQPRWEDGDDTTA